jgi:hypothetical protein
MNGLSFDNREDEARSGWSSVRLWRSMMMRLLRLGLAGVFLFAITQTPPALAKDDLQSAVAAMRMIDPGALDEEKR